MVSIFTKYTPIKEKKISYRQQIQKFIFKLEIKFNNSLLFLEHIYTPTDCIVLALGNYIVNDTDGTKTIANGWIGNTCGYGVDADLLVRYNNATSGEVNVTMASFTNGKRSSSKEPNIQI